MMNIYKAQNDATNITTIKSILPYLNVFYSELQTDAAMQSPLKLTADEFVGKYS